MREMIYKKKRTHREVLDAGIFSNYEYKIVSLGTHPCAYVKLPYTNMFFNLSYDNIPISVHGGLTYSANELDGFWIGWDYAHCGDYTGYLSLPTDRKWTTGEILDHVKSVINQLKHIDDIVASNTFQSKVKNYKYDLLNTIFRTEAEVDDKTRTKKSD